MTLTHKSCGATVMPHLACPECGERVEARDMRAVPGRCARRSARRPSRSRGTLRAGCRASSSVRLGARPSRIVKASRRGSPARSRRGRCAPLDDLVPRSPGRARRRGSRAGVDVDAAALDPAQRRPSSDRGCSLTGPSALAADRVALHAARVRAGLEQPVRLACDGGDAAERPGARHLDLVPAAAQVGDDVLAEALLDRDASAARSRAGRRTRSGGRCGTRARRSPPAGSRPRSTWRRKACSAHCSCWSPPGVPQAR